MRALLIYPKFRESYWSFEKVMELIGRRSMMPPLGLITVAAILPQDWEFRLRDRNIEEVSEEDWDWAEVVLFSGMLVQKADMHVAIREAQARGKPTAAGGPYATSLYPELQAIGVDYLVLDEGEVTIPLWLEDLARGSKGGIYRSGGEKPDVTLTPVPRFDLLDLDAYAEMAVQYSRGCPFLCEFCDIIVLYGRKPRTKAPEQIVRELQALYDLGWRRPVFVVDDNFIGNKKNAKEMLRHLHIWQVEKGFPFTLSTEASVDLAADQELMDLMVDCNFGAVFLGLETPDPASLELTKKKQNLKQSLDDSVTAIACHRAAHHGRLHHRLRRRGPRRRAAHRRLRRTQQHPAHHLQHVAGPARYRPVGSPQGRGAAAGGRGPSEPDLADELRPHPSGGDHCPRVCGRLLRPVRRPQLPRPHLSPLSGAGCRGCS